MKITCPNNADHKRFSVTAHVAQLWEVDEDGDFTKELKACTDVDHQPDEHDCYVCQECGAEATVTGG